MARSRTLITPNADGHVEQRFIAGGNAKLYSHLEGSLAVYSKLHIYHAAAAAKSLQSCPTLCDPIDINPPGSSAHGIFQARVLEWSAIAFSQSYQIYVDIRSRRAARFSSGEKMEGALQIQEGDRPASPPPQTPFPFL